MAHTITQVRDWNAALKTTRSEIVAVFIGGTSGIGRNTALKLASCLDRPNIYIVGRNEAAGAQVIDELEAANQNGSYTFIPADVSQLRNVDTVCQKLKSEIQALDLLFLTSGGLALSKQEGDGNIDINHILRYYSRMRFIFNLLPSLELASSPRVVSVLAAGKEIEIEEDNLDLRKNFSFAASNGYPATMTSLAFEDLASRHPSISFIHVFPGIVATQLMKKSAGAIVGSILSFLTWPISISASESGEWHTFLSTSTEFPSRNMSSNQSSVGSYIINYDGKDVTNKTLMAKLREKDFPLTVWKHTLDIFDQIVR